MGKKLDSTYRIRFILLAIVLASLPVYCTGWIMVQLTKVQSSMPLLTPSAGEATSQIPGLLQTASLTSSATLQTMTATATGTLTGTPTGTPTSTQTSTPTNSLTPTLSPTASATWIPTATFTVLPDTSTPTFTPSPTATFTQLPPTLTSTPVEAIHSATPSDGGG